MMLLQDKKVILDNVCKLVPSLKHAKHVQDWVGLRPYREPVCLQLQHHKVKRLLSNFTHLIINTLLLGNQLPNFMPYKFV